MTEERDEKAGDCFSDDRKRCAWITPKSDQSCIAFHNEEWGVPVHDDKVSQKTMNAHEAEATAEQAVSKVEAAMTAAEEAAKEADAAEAARAYAEEASKTLEGKKTSAKCEKSQIEKMDARTEAMPSSRLQISESNPSTLFSDRVFTTGLPIQNPSTGMYLEASESRRRKKKLLRLNRTWFISVILLRAYNWKMSFFIRDLLQLSYDLVFSRTSSQVNESDESVSHES
ncbi:unnamed protein product [Brassica napus]|uniref:(rape) hypothetical protein n=1 Tax=Brassica napus TaxID=3708 RepID=A0A816K5K2_BRANA|nr:unnamed protein product [Brassica napus]